VDRVTKKEQPNNSPDTLAQPLELKESLRIRDGLGGHDVSPVRFAQFKEIPLVASDLGYLWVSNN